MGCAEARGMSNKLSVWTGLVGALVLTLSLAAPGCDDVAQAIDCNTICNRYKDCFDASYDVSACTDRCKPMLETDPHGADDCAACIDDRSCAGSVFACAADCQGIVP